MYGFFHAPAVPFKDKTSGMKKVQYKIGGKNGTVIELQESKNLVAVRTKKAGSVQSALEKAGSVAVSQKLKVKEKVKRANVTLLEVKKEETNPLAVRNEAREKFKKEKAIRFAGRVLVDAVSKEPVLYTENIYIKFQDDVPQLQCRMLLAKFKLTIKTEIVYDTNAFFVQTPEGTGFKVFDICKKMLALKEVELCEPELVRKKGKKNFVLPKPPVIHPRQWHLKKTDYYKTPVNAHASVDKAHQLSLGEGITIAVIDDGVDIRHPEFNIPGKIIAAFNADDKTENPMPYYKEDNHGTACAGVACASGQQSAAGVAPAARLIPIRNEAGLGSQDEANSFFHAVDNGADIISNSWGPADGEPEDPDDPLHQQKHELADRIRKVISYAVTKGRNGKGCVVLFAAGNGNENADLDGYIANPDVIAVAACNDRGKRSIYSDYGKSIWVCFPSSDWGDGASHPDPVTPGIWTTDRTGKKGYNTKNYTPDFGGTSSACPGVAGVCALMLSVNPDLTAKQVKQILKDTADKIDKANGQYNAKGHSPYYGYGRVNAYKAVKRAKEMKK